MPVTPFHFGPGAALHAVAPKHVSFLAFCAANVFIDVESLYNLRTDSYPVHAFFHTYVGASFVALAIVCLFLAARQLADKIPLPDLFEWRQLTVTQVSIGAAAGAYSHVVLDSIMHADITPLAPFSPRNVLLGAMSLDTLHWSCIVAGVLALLLLCGRRLMKVREQ